MARAMHLELRMLSTRPRSIDALTLGSLAVSLNGCAVIGGIFKAGVWVGVIVVALLVGCIFAVVRRVGGSR